MTRWSLAAVEKAAPDASSWTAARKLATPGPWSETGATDALVWGKCQGSGRTPYQVSVDLDGPAYRCSCPSRKFPCKHALALLTLWARDDPVIGGAGGAGADVAQQWAEQRAGRAAAAAAKTAAPAKPVDEEARAKRQAERARLMDAGIDELALWLADLVRGGTAEARRRPYAWWEAAAARLVDAQLPGLAEQVRDTGADLAGRGDEWAASLLDDLGRWWTVVQAWRRREALDARTAADLRVEVGWALPSSEVRGADDATDRWQVLGAFRTDDGRLQQQRTWLRGLDSGEQLVVLDFAARAQPLPAARLVGTVLHADVARYPGSGPRRALLPDDAVVTATDARLPAGVDLAAAGTVLSDAWTANPWARRVPVVLDDVALSVPDRLVRDAAGTTVPMLLDDDPWALAALTGGRPCRVFGELEAAGFRPLTVEAAP